MVSAAISPTRQSIAEQSQALEELFAFRRDHHAPRLAYETDVKP